MKFHKANWSEQNTFVLCDLCVEQIRSGNCNNGTMKEEGTRLSQISISVPAAGTFLVLHPWTRLAQATAMPLKFKVTIELEGVPAARCMLGVWIQPPRS